MKNCFHLSLIACACLACFDATAQLSDQVLSGSVAFPPPGASAADAPLRQPLVHGYVTPEYRVITGSQSGLQDASSATAWIAPEVRPLLTVLPQSLTFGGQATGVRTDIGLGHGWYASGQVRLGTTGAGLAREIGSGLTYQSGGFAADLAVARADLTSQQSDLGWVRELPRFTYPINAGSSAFARSLVPNLDGSLLGVNSQTRFELGARYAMRQFAVSAQYSSANLHGLGEEGRSQVVELGGIYRWSPSVYTSLAFQKARLDDLSWKQLGGSIRYNWSDDTVLYVSGDVLHGSTTAYGNPWTGGNAQYDVKIGVKLKF